MTREEFNRAIEILVAARDGKVLERHSGIRWHEDVPGSEDAAGGLGDCRCWRIKPERKLMPYTLDTFPLTAACIVEADGSRWRWNHVGHCGLLDCHGSLVWQYKCLADAKCVKLLDHAGNELPKGVEVTP